MAEPVAERIKPIFDDQCVGWDIKTCQSIRKQKKRWFGQPETAAAIMLPFVRAQRIAGCCRIRVGKRGHRTKTAATIAQSAAVGSLIVVCYGCKAA